MCFLNSDALTPRTPCFWLFRYKETLLLTGGWAGWVVGGGWWLVGWLAGWLVGWLAGCWLLVAGCWVWIIGFDIYIYIYIYIYTHINLCRKTFQIAVLEAITATQ